MKKCVKNVQAVVLVTLLALTALFPLNTLNISATEIPKSGYSAEDNTYYIANADDLNAFRDMVNATNKESNITVINAEITDDIDLNPKFTFKEDGYVGSGTPVLWTPISYYSGEINGNGHSIKGIYITNESVNGKTGLIACVKDAEINNLSISNSYINLNYQSTNSVAHVGPLCGEVLSGSLAINSCNNNGVVISNGVTGGLVGFLSTGTSVDVNDSHNTGTVSGTKSSAVNGVGGIIGSSNANTTITVNNVYNDGNVNGLAPTGGIIGYISGTSSITNSYNTGKISGESANHIGGILGSCSGSGTELKINNCYNIGDVEGNNSVGGIAGKIATSTKTEITDFYNKGNITATATSVGSTKYGVGGAFGDYDNTITIKGFINEGNVTGIAYVGGIAGYSDSTSSNLTIDNSSNSGKISGQDGNTYVGGLVGCAHTISILNSKNTGDVEGASYVGGILGNSLNNTTIEKTFNSGSVNASGTQKCGGLIGNASSSTIIITDSLNIGDVTGNTRVGGILGDMLANVKLTLNRCYNAGKIESVSYAGGLIGYVSKTGTSINSNEVFNAGVVTGENSASLIGSTVKIATSIYTNTYYMKLGDANNGIFSGTDSTYNINQLLASKMIDSDAITNSEKMSGLSSDKWYATANDAPLNVESTHTAGAIVTALSGTGYVPNLIALNDVVSPAIVVVDETTMKSTNEVMGYSINVDGIVNVLLHVNLSEDIINDSDAKLILAVPKTAVEEVKQPTQEIIRKTYEVKNLEKDTYGYYVVPCPVSAKEMTQNLVLQLQNGNKDIVQMYNGGQLYDEVTYTVKLYADPIANNTTGVFTEKQVNIAQKMLNYGAYAQLALNYHSDNLANKDINVVLSSKDTVLNAITDDGYYLSGLGSNGVKYYGSSLSLESELIVKHYFLVPTNYKGTPNASGSNIVKQGWNDKDSLVYEVDVKSNVRTINQPSTVYIDGITLTYSPFTYIKKTLDSSSTSEKLKNVCIALYDFYESSK